MGGDFGNYGRGPGPGDRPGALDRYHDVGPFGPPRRKGSISNDSISGAANVAGPEAEEALTRAFTVPFTGDDMIRHIASRAVSEGDFNARVRELRKLEATDGTGQ